MKSVFGFDRFVNKLSIAPATWMLLVHGEGGLEIKNHGRFKDFPRFSQETEATGQQSPRIGENRPKLKELSAERTLNSDPTPQFLFSLRESIFFSLPQGIDHVC